MYHEYFFIFFICFNGDLMEFIYPFFISFIMIFISELGDKTQLLVLSFSNKLRTSRILLGIALGTFFSHGFAILFGSKLSSISSDFSVYLSIFTYFSFILFGVLGFVSSRNDNNKSNVNKNSILYRVSNFKISYVLIIAISIFIGELGDKTFLASLGLGIQYSNFQLSLILGSIFGMICSNSIAIFFGKFIANKFKPELIDVFSNLLFIIFGILGFLNFFLSNS